MVDIKGFRVIFESMVLFAPLAVYGSANGTANGTSSLSVGNVFVTTYTGEASQLWRFVPVE